MNDLNNFLNYWFAGFSEGLEKLGPGSQDILLRACGQACARSYTARVFKDTWERSKTLKVFLVHLAEKFPESSYEFRDEHTIIVRYSDCACDLFRQGWVKTPVLCKCSQHNLSQNFEQVLGSPVTVRILSSLLEGADHCCFEVKMDNRS
ncbi:MAG: hypothetical protein JXA13_03345 [Anaerolineales bacterium]|nr:hypothetical protein [Anaerolineales bacterium]